MADDTERLRALHYAGLAARALPDCVIGPTLNDDAEALAWERGLEGEPSPCGCVETLREMERQLRATGRRSALADERRTMAAKADTLCVARAALGDTEAVE